MRNKLFWIAALLALALPAATASAAPHGHGGGGWGGGGWHGGHGHVIIGGGYWGWGWPYYGYYGYPYGYGYGGYYGGGYGHGGGESWGAVKTDVDPEEARVYLDGQYIGTADDFDGWPDKLYLKPGHYKLEFRLHGYEPLTLDVRSRPGATLEVDNKLHRLEKNASSEPDPPKLEGDVPRFYGKKNDRDRAQAWNEDQDSYSDHRRGDYVDQDRDREENRPAHSDEGWRKAPAQPDSAAPARPARPARTERARLTIHAQPSDAAVYVDDRFVGTADELASMERGIVVTPGKHTVTVSRPGYRDRSTEIQVDAGHSQKVDLTLER